MMQVIVVAAIGIVLGALALLSAKLGGPVLGIVLLVLTLAGWTALVVVLGQTQTEQLYELVIAVVLVIAVCGAELRL